MEQVIKVFAKDAGITEAEAACIFKAFTRQLVRKVPALREVIEDVFENAGEDTLKLHIRKLVQALQEEQRKEIFGKWIIPDDTVITHWKGSAELF